MNQQNSNNPYQPPQANVEPPAKPIGSDLISGGRTVAVGNASAWIGEGWQLFKQSPGIWIASVLILFVLSIVASFIPFLGSLVSNLLMPVFLGGLMIGCRAQDNGEKLQIEHLFSGFKSHAGPLMLIGLLMLVAIVVVLIVLAIIVGLMFGASIMGAFAGNEQAMADLIAEHGLTFLLVLVLLFMALIIPVSMAYWFAPALVVFHGLKPVDAMKQSFQGCLRNMLPFLWYGILLILLLIVGMIPLMLGLLVVVPMMYGSIYASYKDIYLK